VTLGPRTTFRVLQFGVNTRMVALERGEAYFEVAHAAGGPFIVASGAALTQVLGTAFLVRYDPANPHVRVAVTDGKVQLKTSSHAKSGVTLTAGQMGEVTDSTTQVITVDDLSPGTEWTPGRVIFHDTPLATVLQTVSHWYGYQFRLTDQTLGTRNVTMVISTRSSAEALAAIERVLLVNLTVVGDTVTLVPQPARPNRNTPRIRTYDVWTPTREIGR
jgi:transmembrane sensor